jgi:hypothetical protein
VRLGREALDAALGNAIVNKFIEYIGNPLFFVASIFSGLDDLLAAELLVDVEEGEQPLLRGLLPLLAA